LSLVLLLVLTSGLSTSTPVLQQQESHAGQQHAEQDASVRQQQTQLYFLGRGSTWTAQPIDLITLLEVLVLSATSRRCKRQACKPKVLS
jgi:hypothetical protein